MFTSLGERGGGGLPTSSAPRGLKLTGFIDICYLSSYVKWFIFEINSSKIRDFGDFNHFIWFKLKNKVVRRFPHEKIYNPVHFYGDRSSMDREIKGEKSGRQPANLKSKNLNYYLCPFFFYFIYFFFLS